MSSVVAARAKAATFAVPAWFWVAGLVGLSVLARYSAGRHMVAPWILVDELIYSELARSFAESGTFAIRGETVGTGYGVVYPVLVSPAYLLDALPAAYEAAKAINAVLVSLAAVPAYLLARRLVSPALALLAAALAVAVPSLFYAGTVMTENAFYPIFVAAALALVRALERPTIGRTVALLALVALAFATRAQALVFVPAIATAPLVMVLWRRRLVDYRWLYAGLALATGLAFAVSAARGRSPADLLGAYKAAGEHDYRAADIARWLLYHLGEFDLYLGIAPFAAFLLLLSIGRRLPREDQAFLAGAVALSGWLLLQVAAFATQPFVLRIQERNLFYLAPLFFTALVLWIERGAPRPAVRTAAAVGAAIALPPFVPYDRLIGVSATSDTLALLPLWWLHEAAAIPLDRIWVVVVCGAAAIGVLVGLVPRRFALALPALVLVLYALAAQPVDARMTQASVGALFQGITRPERGWVDSEVGRGAEVAALWTGAADRLTVNENEFFSRSVRGVYYLHDPVPGALPQTPVSVDPDDGTLRDATGNPIREPLLLTDESLPIAGTPVARDRSRTKAMIVYRVEPPAGVTGTTEGVYPDLWSEETFTYTGFRCAGETLRVLLQSDVNLFERPQTVTALVAGRPPVRVRVRPEVPETAMAVPLPEARRCTVRFRVTPSAVPAVVRGSEDTRRLGVRVLRLER